MNEELCFVQFPHPGGEHRPGPNDITPWNTGVHRRKFLVSNGQWVDNDHLQDGELVFWGEWEPESAVVEQYNPQLADGPRYLQNPYYVVSDHNDTQCQNTDPFVFGDRFYYTWCRQHRGQNETQLRRLSVGSLILFGSKLNNRFVLDTVFVVAGFIDHTALDRHAQLDNNLSNAYRRVTIDRGYCNQEVPGLSHRLYFGATFEEPVAGMFSFFPCKLRADAPDGFARPVIEIPEYINQNCSRTFKRTILNGPNNAKRLFDSVCNQVLAQGLALGIHADLPPQNRPIEYPQAR